MGVSVMLPFLLGDISLQREMLINSYLPLLSLNYSEKVIRHTHTQLVMVCQRGGDLNKLICAQRIGSSKIIPVSQIMTTIKVASPTIT